MHRQQASLESEHSLRLDLQGPNDIRISRPAGRWSRMNAASILVVHPSQSLCCSWIIRIDSCRFNSFVFKVRLAHSSVTHSPASFRAHCLFPACLQRLSQTGHYFCLSFPLSLFCHSRSTFTMRPSNSFACLAALGSQGSLAHGIPSAQCLCLPGEPCWPAPATWSTLNTTVGGALVQTIPIGNPCHDPNYDAAACTALQQNWFNPLTQ